MKVKPRIIDWRRGQQDTRLAQSEDFDLQILQNARVEHSACERRPGMVSLTKVATAGTCINFDGVDDTVSIPYDARVWNLTALSAWTIEGLCNADDISSERPVMFFSGVIKVHQDSTSSGRIVATVTDSAAADTTLAVTSIGASTLIDWRLTRLGSAIVLYANGSSTSGTITNGTLATSTTAISVGVRPGPATYYDGKIEFVRLFRGVKTGNFDTRCRLLNPRAPSVLADHVMEIDANNYVLDRSQFGNHAAAAGTPGTSASLAVNHAPILGITSNHDNDQVPRLYFAAGAAVYPVKL